jgi:hypothetical protein
MKPPNVDSALTSYGDNGFLAGRPRSLGCFCQHGESPLHRLILGLIAHHSPCKLDQSGAQSAISMLCDRADYPFGPRAIFARTEADMWPYLNDTSASPTYYSNISDIRFYGGCADDQHV